MTSTAITESVSSVRAPETRVAILSAASVEASTAVPVALLLTSAIIWLLAGSVLAWLTFVKLHLPSLFAGTPFLTFGRTEPAHWICILYGFALQAGFGTAIWLTCRLSRSALYYRSLVILSALIWNLATLAAVIAILTGNSSGFIRLEMPGTIAPLFVVSAVLIGISILQTLHGRIDRSMFASSWFIFAAICWFPWILSTAGYFLLINPLRGSVQPVLNLWYANNLATLCIAPFALAVIFYFIPKLTERPIYSRGLAVFGFWTYAIFATCGGFNLTAGLPRWLVSFSAVMTLLLIVPGLAFGMNWYATLASGKGRKSRELSFVTFAAGAFLLSILGGALGALKGVGDFIAYTHFGYALAYLGAFGLAATALLGASHYILPRLCRASDWPIERFARGHFLATITGTVLIVFGFALAGLMQGGALQDASVPFITTVKRTRPGVGLAILGFLVFSVGQALLLVNIFRLYWRCCGNCCGVPNGNASNRGARR
ncbi:MAG: Cytochrome-c oxidase [Verrucomicrobiales bacterium]|nr:Cytochrome-c oxidase [Verrucomicrobiales bacterium]